MCVLCHRVYCHPCIEKLCGDSELERVSGSHLSSLSPLICIDIIIVIYMHDVPVEQLCTCISYSCSVECMTVQRQFSVYLLPSSPPYLFLSLPPSNPTHTPHHPYMYSIHCVCVCVGEGSRTVAMLHVLSSVPHGGAAGQETELGPQAAGTLP